MKSSLNREKIIIIYPVTWAGTGPGKQCIHFGNRFSIMAHNLWANILATVSSHLDQKDFTYCKNIAFENSTFWVNIGKTYLSHNGKLFSEKCFIGKNYFSLLFCAQSNFFSKPFEPLSLFWLKQIQFYFTINIFLKLRQLQKIHIITSTIQECFCWWVQFFSRFTN